MKNCKVTASKHPLPVLGHGPEGTGCPCPQGSTEGLVPAGDGGSGWGDGEKKTKLWGA